MLRPAGGDVYALAVDRIHDHEELVVKPPRRRSWPPAFMPAPRLPTTAARSCCSIRRALPRSAASSWRRRNARAHRRAPASTAGATRQRCCCSAASMERAGRFASPSSTGSRKCRAHGDPPGRRPASRPARRGHPAAGRRQWRWSGRGKVRVFRLNDGAHEIGYAFREVIDLMAMEQRPDPGRQSGAVAAVTLIGGEPAELIDAHWLFASISALAAAGGAAGLPSARATIPGCRTCFARSSRPPAIW